MNATDLFSKLWDQYSRENPSVGQIHQLFSGEGRRVINDHVAFRTFNDSRVNIDVLAKPFIEAGYEPRGEYIFETKKLKARHYELPDSPESPRVFISELLLEEFSPFLQKTIKENLDRVSEDVFTTPDLIFQGRLFKPMSHEIYNRLREESEYAAWLYVFGYRANHFTVSVNYLSEYEGIEEVNAFLKSEGYALNSSGGEVKGTPAELLEQSSTLADQVEVEFQEGKFIVPSCYYEFAKRYQNTDGKLFSAFIAGSADKIFESTDFQKS